MNKVHFVFVILLSIFFACTKQKKSPNILILLADDLGSTDLASFGGKANTPNLDNLTEKGIKFTQFYAPAPNCSPSRTGLLTGRMPSRVGMFTYRAPNHSMHLPDSEITIAEKLKEKGYQTAHFGKWHLSCLPQDKNLNQPQPEDQGFDYSLGTENNANPSHLNPVNFVRNGVQINETSGYSCQLLANEVKIWFQNIYQKDNPFFLYVAFHEVHKKIASPPELMANYAGETKNEAEYLANVENMDNAVGKIIDELKSRGLLENTLVIFASDNGPYKKGSAGNLRGLKGEVYDGGIRVPALLFWENEIQARKEISEPAGLIDVFPTLAEICDFELPVDRKIDGTSLMPILQNQSFVRKTPLMWFFYRSFPEVSMRIDNYVLVGNALDSVPRTHAMSDSDLNFVKNFQPKTFELYNVADDPGQNSNVADSFPEIIQEMKPQMLDLLEEIKTESPNWDGLFSYESLPSKFKKEYIRK